MNLPNRLTLLRIILIPVFIVFVSVKQIPAGNLIAAIVFAFASITDFLDGYIARKQNLVTDFGKFADPLADKILTTVAFIYMVVDGVCHPLVLVVIIVREFAISGVRMIAANSTEGEVIAANIWGKVKTVVQMVAIILYYLMMGIQNMIPSAVGNVPQITAWILCWLVAVITAVSGVQYIWSNRKYINTKQ